MWGGYHTYVDTQMGNYVWDYSSYPECVGKPTGTAEETTPATIPPTEVEPEPTEAESEPTEETNADQSVQESGEEHPTGSEAPEPSTEVPEE